MERILLLVCTILLLAIILKLLVNCFRPYPYLGSSRPIRKIYNQPEHMIEAARAIEAQRSGRHLQNESTVVLTDRAAASQEIADCMDWIGRQAERHQTGNLVVRDHRTQPSSKTAIDNIKRHAPRHEGRY